DKGPPLRVVRPGLRRVPLDGKVDDPGIPPPLAPFHGLRSMPPGAAESLHGALPHGFEEGGRQATREGLRVPPVPPADRLERHQGRRLVQAPLTPAGRPTPAPVLLPVILSTAGGPSPSVPPCARGDEVEPETTRRSFLKGGTLAAARLVAATPAPAAETPAKQAQDHKHEHNHKHQQDRGEYPRKRPGPGGPVGSPTDRGKLVAGLRKAGEPPVPVVTPDLPKLPFTMKGGVKEFHLV